MATSGVTAGPAPDPIDTVVGLTISIVNGDFSFSASGGLVMVSGGDALTQRIAQRIKDMQNTYLFEVGWGAGLASKVQSPLSPGELGQIRAVCISQAALDPAVDRVERVDLRYDGVRLQVVVQVRVAGVSVTLPLLVSQLAA